LTELFERCISELTTTPAYCFMPLAKTLGNLLLFTGFKAKPAMGQCLMQGWSALRAASCTAHQDRLVSLEVAAGVFAVTPPSVAGRAWAEAVIYGFTGADGYDPYAGGVVIGTNGAVYGTTAFGAFLVKRQPLRLRRGIRADPSGGARRSLD
jgi:hypothetical protein